MTTKKPTKAAKKRVRMGKEAPKTTLVKGQMPLGPTPKKTKELCDLLRMGAYLETAASGCNITARTMRRWLQRAGAADDPPSPEDAPYVVFMIAIMEAHAQSEHSMIGGIAQAAIGTPAQPILDEEGKPILDGKDRVVMSEAIKPDWKAGAWLAERKFGGRWAQTRKIDVRVQQGMEQLLDAVRGRMPAKSYRDLIHALDEVRQAELRGDTEVS